MTGSLQIKKDKFYMVLNLTQNGKRRQKWISTGYTVKGNKKKAVKCSPKVGQKLCGKAILNSVLDRT